VENGLTLCDLTQSYSKTGGGIRTYLHEKRKYIDRHTQHRHALIIPGKADSITYEGRHMTVKIASPRVPFNPNYRLLLRSRAVVNALRNIKPDTVECLDAYNLPWAARQYKREASSVSLIAGYRTDLPTAYVERLTRPYVGKWAAGKLRNRAYSYLQKLYSSFDGLYALNEEAAQRLASQCQVNVDILPLGVDLQVFNPKNRNLTWRAKKGISADDPVLIYAGRVDKEKRADIVLEAFMLLPKSMNASLIMLGEGRLEDSMKRRARDERVYFPGFIQDRRQLGKILASSDIYVSAMAFETFGISIIEAQATGLPVVGVAAGAMLDRVPPSLGILGPVNDAQSMAQNIAELWMSGRKVEMSRRARRHVETNFSWDRTFKHLFSDIYPKASGHIFL